MDRIIGIEELLAMLEKYGHRELHVHHTWSPSHRDYNGFNGLKLQEAMRSYHIKTNGWRDIGQHVTLLPDGRFVTGRDFGTDPASISGFNKGAFACEMLGNFDTGHDGFQGPQKETMLKLAGYFTDRGRYVRFHRENAPKTCPGTSIDKTRFLEEVANLHEHWAQKYYDYLTKEKSIDIHELRFDDPITRGEAFALLARLTGYIERESD